MTFNVPNNLWNATSKLLVTSELHLETEFKIREPLVNIGISGMNPEAICGYMELSDLLARSKQDFNSHMMPGGSLMKDSGHSESTK